MNEVRPENVLLIGSCGYIGSRVYTSLRRHGFHVTAVDRSASAAPGDIAADYRTLTPDVLSPVQTVIWLAGHSSVKAANEDPAGAFENNVSGLLRLSDSLRDDQALVYASSASLYSKGSEEPATEITEEVIGEEHQNAYDLSKYALDKILSKRRRNFYGLRFGTVCGTSNYQRNELLLNSMVRSAVQSGKVLISNAEAMRSVLAMNDLVELLERLLQRRPAPGFYDMASYSMSIGDFGRCVAGQLGVDVVELPGEGTYSFSVSAKKIYAALDFDSPTPVESLIDELAAFYRDKGAVNG